MESLQVLENAVIIGGVGFGVFYFWDEIKLLFEGARVVGEKTAEGVEWYAGSVTGGIEAAPTVAKGLKVGIEGELGGLIGVNEEDNFQDKAKVFEELKEMQEKGNVFIDTIDWASNLIGGPVIGKSKSQTPSEFPLYSEFGDNANPKLFQYRVWMSATLKENRKGMFGHTVVSVREERTIHAIPEKIMSFQDSLEWQLQLMDDEFDRYMNSTTTPFIQGAKTNGPAERFTQPSWDLYAGKTLRKHSFVRDDWIQVDSDYSTYLMGMTSHEAPKLAGFLIADIDNDPDKRTYLGLAGELFKQNKNWREEYEKDPDATRKWMVETLNEFELPFNYFQSSSGVNNENFFARTYGLGWNYMNTTLELIDFVNRPQTNKRERKEPEEQLNQVKHNLSKTIKGIFH